MREQQVYPRLAEVLKREREQWDHQRLAEVWMGKQQDNPMLAEVLMREQRDHPMFAEVLNREQRDHPRC